VIRNNLLTRGVIEMDHSYLVGEYSKSYRLTDQYRNVKHRKIEITDERIIQRLTKHKLKLVSEIPNGSEYDLLLDNLYKIKINHTEAIKFINCNYSCDPDIYNAYRVSIDYIHEQTFFFKVDDIAGRVHTNITNLSKKLRQFLRFEGKPLVNIDISNSQPFLFNILIRNFLNSKQVKNFILNYNNNYLNSTYSNPPYVVQFPDIVKYEKLTSGGAFYEYLMKKTSEIIYDRQSFKINFYRKVFFCKSNNYYINKETKLFRKLFPNVFNVILHYKSEDYKQLAINLQKAEANIMINKICKRISIERPEIFVSTIHDSILTTEENKEYICNVILSEFENNFKLKPSLKIE